MQALLRGSVTQCVETTETAGTCQAEIEGPYLVLALPTRVSAQLDSLSCCTRLATASCLLPRGVWPLAWHSSASRFNTSLYRQGSGEVKGTWLTVHAR